MTSLDKHQGFFSMGSVTVKMVKTCEVPIVRDLHPFCESVTHPFFVSWLIFVSRDSPPLRIRHVLIIINYI